MKPKPRAVSKVSSDPLRGRFFHSIKSGIVEWQGQVIGRVSEDVYLIQLFEWGMGEPSIQRLISLSDMKDWLFYSDADEMTHSYDYGTASKKKAKTEDKK